MSALLNKLKSLNLDEDTEVTLSYSEGVDVFVHNETAVETAIEHTDVVTMVAELVCTPGFKNVTPKYGNATVLNSFREANLLESYERGTGNFQEFLISVMEENFYEVEVIDYSTEAYDYKRGFTTLTANFTTAAKDIFNSSPNLFGWKATVVTELGELTLD